MCGAEVAQFLADSRAYVDELDLAIVDALAAGGKLTTMEIIERIGRVRFGWPPEAHILLVFAVGGHLERLQQHGAVVETGDPPIRWRLA